MGVSLCTSVPVGLLWRACCSALLVAPLFSALYRVVGQGAGDDDLCMDIIGWSFGVF